MAYQNTSNNQDKPQTVSTRGYHTFNPNATKATAFEWDYQGEMLKLIITPELPLNEQTEKRRYDYDHSWVTCITRLKCLDLSNQVTKSLLPAMLEKKEDKFVSVPVAGVNQFGIGVKFTDKGLVTYAKLIRNIDPNNLTSKDEIIYEFKKGEVIVDYDNSTGKFGDRQLGETEFLLFISDLDSFISASSKAFNHANRVVDKTYKDQTTNLIKAICNKVGAEIPSYQGQYSGASFGNASLFSSGATNAKTDKIMSLNDLNIEAE